MIVNISQKQLWQQCRQKYLNRQILRLSPPRPPEPLMTGGSYHAGIESFFLHRDVELAVMEADKKYDSYLIGQTLLPEETAVIEREKTFCRHAVREYAKQYASEPFQVLYPEVTFRIPLTSTPHHCYFIHRILHPNEPQELCTDPRCMILHYFQGKTDAVITMNRMVWLMEHKTSGQNQEYWWDQWILDEQITGYIYGIWKATGVRPQGTLLNKISKPNKRQDPTNVSFSREPFIRTDEDLLRFEFELKMLVEDIEEALWKEHIYMTSGACMDYNRRCWFMHKCQNHNEVQTGEFIQREEDYVDEGYKQLIEGGNTP